jgi:hypothetical protein
MCRASDQVASHQPDKLAGKEWLAKRIKESQERLTWCEQTTVSDVLWSIRSAMEDYYLHGEGAR